MANRHLARSIVMQTLFEWDFNGCNDGVISEILKRNVSEFAPGMGDFSFMNELVKNILKKRKTIDAIVEKAAPEWPIEKISIVDRNILRLGLYELLFANKDEVPSKVAINESIELAKSFSGSTSSKFVNGVLGAVYRELGEPGKDEKRKSKKNIDKSKMPLEHLGGGVVYAKNRETTYLAFVHDVFGHWTLSKGKMEPKEKEEEATIRELKEEIGVLITIKEKIGENEYIASDPEKGKIRKRVTYFLAEAPFQKLVLGTSGGLDKAEWFPLDNLPQKDMYDDIIPIVAKGIKLLTKKYS